MAYGGVICEYKISKAKEGVNSYQNYKKRDEATLQKAKDELESLLKTCDDEVVLQEMQEYIIATRQKLELAKQKVELQAVQADQSNLLR